MLWLVVGGAMIGYSAFAYVVRTLPTTTVATYGYVNPVVAVILGALVLGEPVTWRILAGGAAVDRFGCPHSLLCWKPADGRRGGRKRLMQPHGAARRRLGPSMEERKLGTQGLTVSAMGLGCMGMSSAYGTADESEAIATIHRALDLGMNFLDTAEVYGPHTNERLVGRALRGRRDGVIVATKFGFRIGASGVNGTAANAKRVAEESLSRLGIDRIDLYYLHRRDPDVAIEETVGAMKELVDDGKVRYLGLSEVSAETLRRANAVHRDQCAAERIFALGAARRAARAAGGPRARHRFRALQPARTRLPHRCDQGARARRA